MVLALGDFCSVRVIVPAARFAKAGETAARDWRRVVRVEPFRGVLECAGTVPVGATCALDVAFPHLHDAQDLVRGVLAAPQLVLQLSMTGYKNGLAPFV